MPRSPGSIARVIAHQSRTLCLRLQRVVSNPKPIMVTVRLQSVVQHMRGEFLESPGLRLTLGQIQRLWRLDAEDCSAAVQKLLDARFLREERDGTFVRRFY